IDCRHQVTNINVHPKTSEANEAQFQTAKKQIGCEALKKDMLFTKYVNETTTRLDKRESIKDIVFYPVMVGKLDSKLLQDDAIEALKKYLITQATVITPNMTEASILLEDRPLHSVADLKQAAIDLHELGAKYVLVKGGRLKGPAVDV